MNNTVQGCCLDAVQASIGSIYTRCLFLALIYVQRVAQLSGSTKLASTLLSLLVRRPFDYLRGCRSSAQLVLIILLARVTPRCRRLAVLTVMLVHSQWRARSFQQPTGPKRRKAHWAVRLPLVFFRLV